MKKITLLLFSLSVLLALNVHAQSWRANADNLVVNQLFTNETNYSDIFVFPEVLTSSDTIYLSDGSALKVPYSQCYAYFIDLQPFANWSHPCKYVFVNTSLQYSIVSANMPPTNDGLIGVQLLTRPTPSSSVPCTFDSIMVRNEKSANSDHLWAVLICGNEEANWGIRRFWFDLAGVYTVLTNVYGYQEAGSYGDLSNRRIIVSASKDIEEMHKGSYACGDLNGNNSIGTTDVGDFFAQIGGFLTIHSKENIQNIFECFAGISPYQEDYEDLGLRELTEEDQLFVYITGHGGHDNYGSYIGVKEGNRSVTQLYDSQLVGWLHDIKCSQMTLVMQNCSSGGFIDAFMDDIDQGCACKNRIGQSATSSTGLSFAEGYRVYASHYYNTNDHLANEFTYYWVSAALGYYPYYRVVHGMVDKGPWDHPASGRNVGDGTMDWSPYFSGAYENTHHHSDYDVDPDTDQDGFLSFHELFEFANNLDTWSPQGYYHPNNPSPQDTIEYPQQQYESSFTEEAATLAGYRGQMDGVVNSGTATQPYRLCGDLWVSQGARLVMSDDVLSPGNVSIYVKPKGRLVLDGATLTNLPESHSPMWNGIQVWGDRSKHQAMENGAYWQGYVELKNGATIENAVVGIDVWKPNDYTTTGGIVRATDAHFVNNTRAVHFHPYENQFENPNQPGVMVVNDNVSRFKNCTFSVGSDYNGPGEFVDHVRLDVVRGVRFEGCGFTFVDNLYSNPWPMGLYAYNAGFHVKGACIGGNHSFPCQVFDNSSFDGFHKAVVSVNDGSVGTRPAFVRNTDFTNNNFGVFAVRSGFATVLNSTFGIGKRRNRCAAGIFVESTPNFTIEQDTFGLAQQYPEENYGIVVKDSKSQNLIYGNVFKGLHCANLSDGRNNTWLMPRETSGAKADILGLEYRCNDNTGNLCDFYVLGGSSVYVLGIQTNQGKQYAPANNTFSQGSAFQFTNHGNNGVNYYHDPNLPGGTPSGILGVTLVPTADTTGCPSHYDGNGTYVDSGMDLVLTDAQRRQREEDYGRAYAAYNAIRAIYDSRIDGGDTDAEIADVVSATPADMWDLRARLLGHSPYLTKGVLTAVADKSDVFPQSVLFEILASNPDELKSDSLMSYLGNMDQPLPDYMIALLRQIADGTSARTAMESEMARCVQEFRLAAGDIVRSILADTVVDKAELVRWLGNMEDMETDREIVGVYLEDGRYDDALALAGMFPTLYGLAGEDLEEHNDYMALLNLYGGSLGSGRNTMQLDSVERAAVEHFADYGTGTPQAMAKALLMGAYGYRYNDCPVGVDLTSANTGRSLAPDPSSEDLNRAMGFSVTVAPNPASTWVAVDYALPPGTSKAQMTITNALGVTVAAYDLLGNASQKVLDLRDIADGVYAYTVYCGKLSQTGKLVIVK